MTPEEAKSLKPGDVVLLRAVVHPNQDGSEGQLVVKPLRDEGEGRWFVATTFIHSVLPRPLEVGDRVKHDEFGEGVLRYVEGDEAVMRVDPTPTFEGLFCVTLSELERVSQ